MGRRFEESTKNTFTDDYTYTVLDRCFRPYDVLENLLSAEEGKMKQARDQVLNATGSITSELRTEFCRSIALTACRLPHVMRRAHRRRIELAYALAEVARMDRAAFEAKLASFGQIVTDAEYTELRTIPEDELIRQAEYLAGLSPQSPDFPEQDALQGIGILTEVFKRMEIEILESSGLVLFIVGDTPIPDAS